MNQTSQSTLHILKYILLHEPESVGIHTNHSGWVDINEMINQASIYKISLTLSAIYRAVREDRQQHFMLSDDGARIRILTKKNVANDRQHYEPGTPPRTLYHCVSIEELNLIRQSELKAISKKYLELLEDRIAALTSKKDPKQVVILGINSEMMHYKGYLFYKRADNIWLTKHVPLEFIAFPQY